MIADGAGPSTTGTGPTTSGFLAEYRAAGPNTLRTAHVLFASLLVLVCLGGTIGWSTGHLPMPDGPVYAAGMPASVTLLVRAIRMGVLVEGGRIVVRRLFGTCSWPASEIREFD